MATSSITHNFVIKTVEGAERFANAIEESMNNNPEEMNLKGHELTDSDEIVKLLAKRKKHV